MNRLRKPGFLKIFEVTAEKDHCRLLDTEDESCLTVSDETQRFRPPGLGGEPGESEKDSVTSHQRRKNRSQLRKQTEQNSLGGKMPAKEVRKQVQRQGEMTSEDQEVPRDVNTDMHAVLVHGHEDRDHEATQRKEKDPERMETRHKQTAIPTFLKPKEIRSLEPTMTPRNPNLARKFFSRRNLKEMNSIELDTVKPEMEVTVKEILGDDNVTFSQIVLEEVVPDLKLHTEELKNLNIEKSPINCKTDSFGASSQTDHKIIRIAETRDIVIEESETTRSGSQIGSKKSSELYLSSLPEKQFDQCHVEEHCKNGKASPILRSSNEIEGTMEAKAKAKLTLENNWEKRTKQESKEAVEPTHSCRRKIARGTSTRCGNEARATRRSDSIIRLSMKETKTAGAVLTVTDSRKGQPLLQQRLSKSGQSERDLIDRANIFGNLLGTSVSPFYSPSNCLITSGNDSRLDKDHGHRLLARPFSDNSMIRSQSSKVAKNDLFIQKSGLNLSLEADELCVLSPKEGAPLRSLKPDEVGRKLTIDKSLRVQAKKNVRKRLSKLSTSCPSSAEKLVAAGDTASSEILPLEGADSAAGCEFYNFLASDTELDKMRSRKTKLESQRDSKSLLPESTMATSMCTLPHVPVSRELTPSKLPKDCLMRSSRLAERTVAESSAVISWKRSNTLGCDPSTNFRAVPKSASTRRVSLGASSSIRRTSLGGSPSSPRRQSLGAGYGGAHMARSPTRGRHKRKTCLSLGQSVPETQGMSIQLANAYRDCGNEASSSLPVTVEATKSKNQQTASVNFAQISDITELRDKLSIDIKKSKEGATQLHSNRETYSDTAIDNDCGKIKSADEVESNRHCSLATAIEEGMCSLERTLSTIETYIAEAAPTDLRFDTVDDEYTAVTTTENLVGDKMNDSGSSGASCKRGTHTFGRNETDDDRNDTTCKEVNCPLQKKESNPGGSLKFPILLAEIPFVSINGESSVFDQGYRAKHDESDVLDRDFEKVRRTEEYSRLTLELNESNFLLQEARLQVKQLEGKTHFVREKLDILQQKYPDLRASSPIK